MTITFQFFSSDLIWTWYGASMTMLLAVGHVQSTECIKTISKLHVSSIYPSVYEILWSLAHIHRAATSSRARNVETRSTIAHHSSCSRSRAHIHLNYGTENAYDGNYAYAEQQCDVAGKKDHRMRCLPLSRYHKREHHIYMHSILK